MRDAFDYILGFVIIFVASCLIISAFSFGTDITGKEIASMALFISFLLRLVIMG